MKGKTVYIWQAEQIAGGDAFKIATLLTNAGFEGAILHHENLAGWRTQTRVSLVSKLKEFGLKVYGGAAIYGTNPRDEGSQAAGIVKQYQLDGFVFDAESKWDAQPTAVANVTNLLYAYHDGTLMPSAWCWWARYRSPSGSPWHPADVLKEAMRIATVGMPMAYWSGSTAGDAITLLGTTISQWREMAPDKPLAPIGRAYSGDGGTVSPDAIWGFDEYARKMGATGISWWSMQHAFALPGIWAALSQTRKFTNPADQDLAARVETLEDQVSELIARINNAAASLAGK